MPASRRSASDPVGFQDRAPQPERQKFQLAPRTRADERGLFPPSGRPPCGSGRPQVSPADRTLNLDPLVQSRFTPGGEQRSPSGFGWGPPSEPTMRARTCRAVRSAGPQCEAPEPTSQPGPSEGQAVDGPGGRQACVGAQARGRGGGSRRGCRRSDSGRRVDLDGRTSEPKRPSSSKFSRSNSVRNPGALGGGVARRRG
jgi:hypothetical protein